MPKKDQFKAIQAKNELLKLENSVLDKKIKLAGKQIENSLSSLGQGLLGNNFGGGPASPLTSFNPVLQNNQYAPITLFWTNLMYMYTTHGLVQTAIDMPVLDALRGGLEFDATGELNEDDIEVLQEWLDDNNVLERVGDAFIWARLFGGGALVLNTESVDHSEPLGDELFDGHIEFYDACRWELSCDRRIPSSGKYGYYGRTLDQSRVLTIVGKRAPWLVRAQLGDWGMSELQRVIEDFNLFLRTRNVIYELLEEAKVDIYQFEGFTGQLASPQGTQITQRRVQLMNQIKSFNNALLLDAKDKYEMKQMSFGGLAEIMKENRMGIASAFRMPMSKLFGIPSTGFSSGEDDIENYNGLIESEVRQPMKAVIRKVLKIAVKHLFKEDLHVGFNFKPLRVLSALDEETVKTAKFARIMSLYDKMLMESEEVGQAVQKDNLVSVQLKAEKGLLDEHPQPPMMQMAGAEGGEEGEKAETEKPQEAESSAKPDKPETPEKPKKPSI